MSWVADRFTLGRPDSMEGVARGAMGEVHRIVTDTGSYAVRRAVWGEDPDDVVESRARGVVTAPPRRRSGRTRTPRAGVELPEGPELFASGVAVWLTFLAAQIEVLLDPHSEPEHRELSLPPVQGLLEDVPTSEVLPRRGTVAARGASRERPVRPRTMGP